ncbi:MAG: hypothetical protein ABIP95_15225 [Pelobium sp.]
MAEIKIEKKKPIWPWVLVGIIILAFILYFFLIKDKMNSQAVTQNTDSTAMGMDNRTDEDAVATYINFVNADTSKMSLSHEYSHEALTKLANATEAMSNKTGVDVKANLDEVRQLSQNITDNPNATTHADDIKKASIIIATALGNIQKAKFADLSDDSTKLMNDANAVDENDLTLDQKSTVQTFYDAAADLLQKMNSNY